MRISVRPDGWLVIAGLAAVWLAALLLGGAGFDNSLLLGVYSAERPWIVLAAMGFTFLGNGTTLVPITIIAAILLLALRRAPDAAWLVLVSLTGRALVILQKIGFARIRPEEQLRLVDVSSLSFPSGHAANSMLVFGGIALLMPARWRRAAMFAAVTLALLIGASRPMLGVHWPSDVLGGWAFAALWLLLCWRVAPARHGGRRHDVS